MVTGKIKFFCIQLFYPVIRLSNRVRWRFGRAYRCSYSSIEPHVKHIAPGMVIVTRRDYELTNLFIYSYWTHAGLVVSDNVLVEAVGKGIRKTTIEKFFEKVDDFAVYSPGVGDPAIIRKACEYAEKSVGLTYNFSFRLKKRSYYCSELIYRAFEAGFCKCSGTFEYTEFGRPYWEGKMIITPEWLVASPLSWEKIASNGAEHAADSISTGTDHMPLPRRAPDLLHKESGLFHVPGDKALCTES